MYEQICVILNIFVVTFCDALFIFLIFLYATTNTCFNFLYMECSTTVPCSAVEQLGELAEESSGIDRLIYWGMNCIPFHILREVCFLQRWDFHTTMCPESEQETDENYGLLCFLIHTAVCLQDGHSLQAPPSLSSSGLEASQLPTLSPDVLLMKATFIYLSLLSSRELNHKTYTYISTRLNVSEGEVPSAWMRQQRTST